jgi:hypothetical protein
MLFVIFIARVPAECGDDETIAQAWEALRRDDLTATRNSSAR